LSLLFGQWNEVIISVHASSRSSWTTQWDSITKKYTITKKSHGIWYLSSKIIYV
jgi:hypothetical protein